MASKRIFPVLRLLLPGADRERDSYGVRVKSLRDLYIKVLGISESSTEARKLSGYDEETGGGGASSSEDFADRVFRLMQGRCPPEGSLTVWEVNERLDAIGGHYVNGERRRIGEELERLVGGMSQVDQKWLIRILLKNLRLGMSLGKILGVYHAKAGQLYDRFSNLSKVCEVVESGEGWEELGEGGGSVELFHPVKPMLCQRVDLKLVDGMLKRDEYWLETKMDGERFQIHKDGVVFKYFSRNSYEYNVKAVKSDNPTLRPCFCVYDVLFLNGKSLIAVPYAERIRLLGTLIKPKVGVLTTCKRIKVERRSGHQEAGLDYSPNERNAGWYKIKPDYIDNLVSDFDLLIMGGFYNAKRSFVNTYLVGVLDKSTEDTFLAVTKVGIGLSVDQWRTLNTSLRPHWREVTFRREGRSKISEEPPGLRWGQTAPDVWIPPNHSIVLQLKGSELVRSASFATSYTIRFPRITAIRSDKDFKDVCTGEEFARLCSANTTVAKLAKRHVTAADLLPPSGSTSRKRKQISPLKSRQRSAPPLPQPEEDAPPPLDDICSGLDFCVLSTAKGAPSIRELETTIRRHGGRTVKNPGPKTYAVIAGERTFLVSRIIETRRHNVATVEWVLRTLGGPQPRTNLPDFTPNDLLAATDELREQLAERFDRFGDSLTEPITGPDEMRALLKQMNVAESLSARELRTGQREILGVGSSLRMFRGLVARLYEDNLKGEDGDVARYRARFGMLKFVRNGGGWVGEEEEDAGGTHVFVVENGALDRERLREWVDGRGFGQARVVRLEWIQASLGGKRLCEEQLYSII
ncbi:DNA ligase 4 [Culex quinquefasciatus]|uniref:DNA ligase IV n=1 Tax=Culex quinquefasciatus TaxID=7176 RepID=B0XJH0_CULQU|nr:DNA ligase 4 [Culex quinquefasciatus]|eukprot:XP_001869792.1 DNA ligase 4 [Culex quinquefasciatus]